jgi:hypothetical protein
MQKERKRKETVENSTVTYDKESNRIEEKRWTF